jgi:uncharacterized lipoprotein YbaY
MLKRTLTIGLLSLVALLGCAPKEEAAPPPTAPSNLGATAQQVTPNQAMAGATEVRPPMKPSR